jgi:hypothetical protein
MVRIYGYFGILGFHGNIGLLHNAGNSPFDSTLHNYNAKRFGANELVDMHRSRTTIANFFVFNTSDLVKIDRDLQRIFYKMCRYFLS